MRQILILAAEYPPLVGGVGTFARGLARALTRAGAAVLVVTTVPDGSQRRFRPGSETSHDAFTVRRTPGILNRKGIKIAPLAVAGLLAGRRHALTLTVAMTVGHEAIAAWCLRRLVGLPYVVIAHGTEFTQLGSRSVRRWLTRGLLRDAAKVLANSEFTKRLVESLGVEAARVRVLHPPVDLSEFAVHTDDHRIDRRYGLSGRRVMLTASRLVARKGHDQVLRALAELRSSYPDLFYVATGEGAERAHLERRIRELRLEDAVLMPGFVPDDDLRALYHRAELYVSPSCDVDGDIEGFGIALVEAAAAGLPVVAGRSGGVGEAVIDHETGLLVDSGDTTGLVAALRRMLDDDALRARLGRNAKVRVEQDLSLERQAIALAAVVAEVSA